MTGPSLFLRDFDEELRQETQSRLVAPSPSYSEAELTAHAEKMAAQAREEGRAEGLMVGKNEAEAGLIATQTAVLQGLKDRLDTLMSSEQARGRKIEADALGFLLDLADKFVPDLVAHVGPHRVTEELRKIVRAAQGSPWLDITLPEQLLPLVKQGGETGDDPDGDPDGAGAALRGGPRITWHGVENMAPGEVHARWQDGRADYDFGKACRSAIAMIEEMNADLKKECAQNDG